VARSDEFAGGADEVRQPQFKSVQQMHNANFRALSVLDTPAVIPNANGLAPADHERRVMGRTESTSGRSTETFDRQLWLHHAVTRRDQQEADRS
jgi:hypothetical protein